MKKVFLKNYGCQMNVRDSEVICGLLRAKSYELTTDPSDADVIIFNTCSVRQHAEDKVWSEIGRLKKLGSRRTELGVAKFPTPNSQLPTKTKPLIGLVGCMAQNYKEEAFQRSPHIDFVVGPSDIHKIPEIISKILRGQSPSGTVPSSMFEIKIWETEGDIRPEEIYHTGFYEDKRHAFIVISEGCDNYCSYCVVPYVRGPLRNRNYKDILREIEEATSKGISEITLLGQNVNAYQFGVRGTELEVNFIRLLEMVNQIERLKEFSFITSHPKDTSLDLFKAMSDCEKLKKCLHLPVQSGSDKILRLMNRGYTRRFYLDLVDNYRKIVKDAVLTSDIIVGFPGESEKDFKETLDLVKEVQFNAAYVFKYSPRPHTEAAKLADDIENKVKEERHKVILDLQKKISKKLKC
jgi:tRNA-2-methylthio-N6-dimethylallyladenosine synthase